MAVRARKALYLISARTTEDETFTVLTGDSRIDRAAKLAEQACEAKGLIGYVVSVEVTDVDFERVIAAEG